MVSLNCTGQFLRTFERLLKKKNHYFSVPIDISNHFNNTCYSDLCKIGELRKTLNHLKFIKVRLNNSGMKKGDRGGFRVYFLADSKTETITFLTIYPKTGPLQCALLSPKEEAMLLEDYIEAKKHNSLIAVSSFMGIPTQEALR